MQKYGACFCGNKNGHAPEKHWRFAFFFLSSLQFNSICKVFVYMQEALLVYSTVLALLGKITGIYLENKIPLDFKTVLTS